MSEEETEWEVQKVLQRGRFNNITHYLVHWRGYEESEATWEPITNLENCEDAIMQFENAIQSKVKSPGESKRRRGRRSNKELMEEKQLGNELIREDEKSIKNREEASTAEIQSRKNVESRTKDEGSANQQELLKKHMQIDAKREDKIVQKLSQTATEQTSSTIKSSKRQRRSDNSDQKSDEMEPQIKPRKKFKMEEEETEPQRKKPLSSKHSKFSSKDASCKDFRNTGQNSEIAKEYLSKMAQQNAQMELIKQMLGSIKKHEEIIQQEPVLVKELKPNKEQAISQPIPIVDIQPILKKEEIPAKPIKKSVRFAAEPVVENNLLRYYRCDQQHWAQKRTMLMNIIRKEQGIELKRHKARTIELLDQTLILSELQGLPRVRVETGVDRLELLIRLPYGWSAICKSNDKGLFIADVNLIQKDYWTAIEQKYLSSS